MAMDEEKGSSLFAECIIAIISSKELPARQAREVRLLLFLENNKKYLLMTA